MLKIRYADSFIDAAASIRLSSKRREIRQRIEQLSTFPNLGSVNLPGSIKERYGGDVRKLVIDPFIVINEIRQSEIAVYVLGLIHQRAAR